MTSNLRATMRLVLSSLPLVFGLTFCELAFAQDPFSDAQAPAAPAPVAPASPAPMLDNLDNAARFPADFGERLWYRELEMPVGNLAPESDRKATPSLDIKITRIAGALLNKATVPTIAANPGKNFAVNISVEYQTTEPTKLFANLKLDAILPEAEKQKLMQWHASTWHFDNESSPVGFPISTSGSLQIQLIGTAPMELGEFDFMIDVGLMPKQSGGFMKRLYPVKLVTQFTKPLPLQPNAVAFHSATSKVAVGGMDGKVRLLNAVDGTVLQTWTASEFPVQSLAFSNDGKQVAVGLGRTKSDDNSTKPLGIYSVEDGTLLRSLDGHSGQTNSLVYDAQERLVSCDSSGLVQCWDTKNGKVLSNFQADGPVSGLSYSAASQSVCAVVNNTLRLESNTETRTRTIQKCLNSTETRVRTEKQSKTVTTQKLRTMEVDFEGTKKQVNQTKEVLEDLYTDVVVTYTVQVPITVTEEVAYTIMIPSVVRDSANTDKPPAVVQLTSPDLKLLGRWTPEGERMPVGTSFNQDGSRIFVATSAGISVLESKSMIELVDIREKGPGSVDTIKPIHHQSPFFLAHRDTLVTPNVSQVISLAPSKKLDVDYFESLTKSASDHKQRNLQLANSVRQTSSPAPPIPTKDSPPSPMGPTAATKRPSKPLLNKVESDKKEVLLTKYNFNELGFDEPIETKPKSYMLGGLEHEDVLAAKAPNSISIPIPEGFASFTTYFGLQDNREGSVAFVIRGDGKPLYRSSVIRDHIIHGITLDIRGIKRLELIAENAFQDRTNDEALWIDPTIYRELLPDVYPIRFEEVYIKANKFYQLDLKLDRSGFESLGVLKSKPELTLFEQTWKPSENRLFQDQKLLAQWKGDLDFARARVHMFKRKARDNSSVSYSHQQDHIRIQCSTLAHTVSDIELVVQVPYKTTSNDLVSTEPKWTNKWRVGAWSYPAASLTDVPKEVPPKETKPIGVIEVDNINWDWNNEPFAINETPNDHFILIGERKFESDGGKYRIETITDDGIRVRLDEKIILDNWNTQAPTQNAILVDIAPGVHKLRFEYFDAIQRSRLGITVRCIEPKGAELGRRVAQSSDESERHRLRQDAMKQLRSKGVYLFEELNAPESRVTAVDLLPAKGKVDAKMIDLLYFLPEIRHVIVGPNKWTMEDWLKLGEMKSLQSLTLEHDSIDLKFFDAIANLKGLQKLCVLGNGVGDEQIAKLEGMPNLRSFEIWYAVVTDKCLDSLLKMPKLTEFYQGSTKISEAGMTQFKKSIVEKKLK
jgi:hypothetical protein